MALTNIPKMEYQKFIDNRNSNIISPETPLSEFPLIFELLY